MNEAEEFKQNVRHQTSVLLQAAGFKKWALEVKNGTVVVCETLKNIEEHFYVKAKLRPVFSHTLELVTMLEI